MTQPNDIASEELLYENDHARVVRRTLQGGLRVVVKRAVGAEATRRLAHEVTMLARLATIAGWSKWLSPPRPSPPSPTH